MTPRNAPRPEASSAARRFALPLLIVALLGPRALVPAYVRQTAGPQNPNEHHWLLQGTPCAQPGAQGCVQPQVNPAARTITFSLNLSGASSLAQRLPGALARAARSWSAAAPAEVNLALGPPTSSRAGLDGVNTVYLETQGMGGALARTLLTVLPGGEIVDADIAVNAGGYFSPAGGFDLEATLLHELGHALGLDHSPIGAAAMFPTSRPNDTRVATLHSDDIAGLSAIYPPSSPIGGFSPGYGSLAGTAVEFATGPGGVPMNRQLEWMHVFAVERSTGRVVAGTITRPSPHPTPGSFQIDFLPVGSYEVWAEPIDPPGSPLFDENFLSGIYNPTAAQDNPNTALRTSGPVLAVVTDSPPAPPVVLSFGTAAQSGDIDFIVLPEALPGQTCSLLDISRVTLGIGQTTNVGVIGPGLAGSTLGYSARSGLTTLATAACASWPSIVNTLRAGAGTARVGAYNLEVQLGGGEVTIAAGRLELSAETKVGIAAGRWHAAALKSDGTLLVWGRNTEGQLGLHGASGAFAPWRSVEVVGAVAAAAGGHHTVVLLDDGSLSAFGNNSSGQLGDGSTAPSELPVKVAGIGGTGTLAGVIAVAAGLLHTLALLDDGSVAVWGDNELGQLGQGTSGAGTGSTVPLRVSGLSGAIAIACGAYHSLVLLGDGTVRGWGANSGGNLGNGAPLFIQPTPVAASGLSDVKAIAAGSVHSLALRGDGSVWSFGDGGSGALGDGGTAAQSVPVRVVGPGTGFLADIKAIAAGRTSSFAVRADGRLYAWGDNGAGQLGTGRSGNYELRPVLLDGIGEVIEVAAGEDFTLALRNDLSVWSWGADFQGQLGDGAPAAARSAPAPIADGFSGFAAKPLQLAAGGGPSGPGGHTLALERDGTVMASGRNTNGQLGTGDLQPSATPVRVLRSGSPLAGIVSVAAGENHSLALEARGTVLGWGRNLEGQVGNGGRAASVLSPAGVLMAGAGTPLGGVRAIAAGRNHSLALRGDGTVWAWGDNRQGQLGDGTSAADRLEAVQVGGLAGIRAIAAGAGHSLALGSDGTVWAWGDNSRGQLGDGGFPVSTLSNVPVRVALAGAARGIAAGAEHSLALLGDGSVWAWGANDRGQAGRPSPWAIGAPRQVIGAGGTGFLRGVKQVEAGSFHSLALTSSGAVWGWGDNASGQLGIGATGGPQNGGYPSPVSALAGGIIAVAAGGDTTLNLGSVWACGDNSDGQFGDGTRRSADAPVSRYAASPEAPISGLVVSGGEGGGLRVAWDAPLAGDPRASITVLLNGVEVARLEAEAAEAEVPDALLAPGLNKVCVQNGIGAPACGAFWNGDELAINCGGPRLDPGAGTGIGDGRVWQEDSLGRPSPFLASRNAHTADFTAFPAAGFTVAQTRLVEPQFADDPRRSRLFATERWDNADIHYRFALPAGDYDVTLLFAEGCCSEGCQDIEDPLRSSGACRVFDVLVDGALVEERFSQHVEAQRRLGRAAALPNADWGVALAMGPYPVRSAGVINVVIRDLGEGNPPENASIKGIAIAPLQPPLPILAVEPLLLDFGKTALGETASRTLYIRNRGRAPLAIHEVASTNPVFRLATPPPDTLLPGAEAAVVIEAAGARRGLETGALRIASDDPAAPLVEVALQAEFTAARSCCEAPYSLGFSTRALRGEAPFAEILGGASAGCAAAGGMVTTSLPPGEALELYAGIVSASQQGVEAWSLSIEVEGDIDLATVTVDGTAAAPTGHGGLVRSGFAVAEIADPAQSGGRRGAVSAVVLCLTCPATLPPSGTQSVLRLDVVPAAPAGDGPASGRLFFAGGLTASGQPVANLLAAGGREVEPCNAATAEVTVVIERARDLFRRGDASNDGTVDISDAIYALSYLFTGGRPPICAAVMDANDDGRTDISDPVYLLGYLFLGGLAPPPPFPGCGLGRGGEGCASSRCNE